MVKITCTMINRELTNGTDRDKEIEIILPNGTRNIVRVRTQSTVRELKVIFESQFGIPAQLQKIYMAENDKDIELQNWLTTSEGALTILVPIWWARFVCGVLNNDIENVCRRIQIPMQQISKQERVFVAIFMSCCRGQEDMVSRLVSLNVGVDISTATDTGRTLFHSCALSGNLKCLEIVIKHLMSASFDGLNSLDVNRENALQIAERLDHRTVAKLLSKLMSMKTMVSEAIRYSVESDVGLSEEEERSPNSPYQIQATSEPSVNTSTISLERIAVKNKQIRPANDEGAYKSDNTQTVTNPQLLDLVLTEYEREKDGSDANEIRTDSLPGNLARQCFSNSGIGLSSQSMCDVGQNTNSPKSSSFEDSELNGNISNLSPIPHKPQSMLFKPLLGRRHKEPEKINYMAYRCHRNNQILIPNIGVSDESSEDEERQTTRLPSLGDKKSLTGHSDVRRCSPARISRQIGFRCISMHSSPVTTPRHSPVEEDQFNLGVPEMTNSKSAPNSPQITRVGGLNVLRTPGFHASTSAPNSPSFQRRSRRQSEPFAPLSGWNTGGRLNRLRKSSLASPHGHNDSKYRIPDEHRAKSRSICEVSLSESLHNYCLNKAMESEPERLERPWNAWIVAKRQESCTQSNSLVPMPEEHLTVPKPSDNRRRSFQQWLNDKDLDYLRQLHAEDQLEDRKTDRQVKGKSFEEWLEDKHRESQKEKEREKEKEEAQKGEVELKHRRRKMSQAKYQSWLQEKESKALQEEEKLLGQAKEKLEKMRAKWEEDDERKKKHQTKGKQPAFRTHSCPTAEGPRNISRQRFSSLQVKSK